MLIEGPALQIEMRPIEQLVPYARNARTHSDEQVTQIAASIAEFGFTNPILIGEDALARVRRAGRKPPRQDESVHRAARQ